MLVFQRPAAGRITSYFGEADGRPEGRPHGGIDFASTPDPNTYAAAGGTVVFAGWYGEFGVLVIIDHGDGWATWYAHHRDGSLLVTAADVVAAGTRLGVMGSTGLSFGDHLHWEVRRYGNRVNPLPLLAGTAALNLNPILERTRIMAALAIARIRRNGVGEHYLFVSATRVSISRELSTLAPDKRDFETGVMRAVAHAAGYPAGYVPPFLDDSPNGGWYLRDQLAARVAGMPAGYPLTPSNPFETH